MWTMKPKYELLKWKKRTGLIFEIKTNHMQVLVRGYPQKTYAVEGDGVKRTSTEV